MDIFQWYNVKKCIKKALENIRKFQRQRHNLYKLTSWQNKVRYWLYSYL